MAVSPGSTDHSDDAADRRCFDLSDRDWSILLRLLNRPAQRRPELVTLLRKSPPWDER